MKSNIWAIAAGVLLGVSTLWGAYTWTITRDLNTSSWSNNFTIFGSLTQSTYGGYTGVGNSGQMIYNGSTILQSANMVVRIPGSGTAKFSEYLGAKIPTTGDTGPVGPFIETDLPLSGTTATIQISYGTVGSLTLLSYASVTPHDNMTVMTVLGAWPGNAGYTVGVYVDNVLVLSTHLLSSSYPLGGWSAGFGVVYGGAPGFLIAHIDIGQAAGTPAAIPSSSITPSPATNYIDLAWPAGSDGSTGMGVMRYEIWRGGALLGTTTGLSYSDTTVNPSTPYSYTLKVVDYFFNEGDTTFIANSLGITSSPPPSGTPEGRRVGVRTTGAYWGASPENIDVRSGNLSFSLPLLSVQGRAGLTAGFSLSYNSQNWRYASGLNTQFDGDVGYGFGWRLQAGSIMPVWNPGGVTASYFLFIDSTGSEYRLDNQEGATLSKQLKVSRGTASGSLTTTWTVDSDGRLSSVTYPAWKACGVYEYTCTAVPASSYTYGYDAMGRLSTMTDPVNTRTLISGMTYGVANEVQQITSGYTAGVNSETHTYNSMFQLTQLQVGSALNIQYAFSATQNNGKIISQTDVISGEQVLYAYDSLNRLASAQTAGSGGWGQSYTYDGYGNLTDQGVIKGSVPTESVAYDYNTNRQTGESADANGNIGAGNIYDLENRLVQPYGSTARYGYDPGHKRMWRGDTGLDEIAFWAGQKLATYQIVTFSGSSTLYFGLRSTNVYFGGKLISKGACTPGSDGYCAPYSSLTPGDLVTFTPVAADRLGSIGKYYPYGIERPSATTNDTEKFTGYFRDASTGLDYADQRYHQPGVGRFMSPDPYSGSASGNDPGSLNRYAYVGGDPVNETDPTGLAAFTESDFSAGIYGGILSGAANGSFAENYQPFGNVVSSVVNQTILGNIGTCGACGAYTNPFTMSNGSFVSTEVNTTIVSPGMILCTQSCTPQSSTSSTEISGVSGTAYGDTEVSPGSSNPFPESSSIFGTAPGMAPNQVQQSPAFGSCTFTGKVGMSLGTTTLDAVGIIPGGGNILHGIQFGAGILSAGLSVFGSVGDAGLSATGLGLALADKGGASIAIHGVEMIPVVGNIISAGATAHDIFGGEGLIANYKGCMAGTHP